MKHPCDFSIFYRTWDLFMVILGTFTSAGYVTRTNYLLDCDANTLIEFQLFAIIKSNSWSTKPIKMTYIRIELTATNLLTSSEVLFKIRKFLTWFLLRLWCKMWFRINPIFKSSLVKKCLILTTIAINSHLDDSCWYYTGSLHLYNNFGAFNINIQCFSLLN